MPVDVLELGLLETDVDESMPVDVLDLVLGTLGCVEVNDASRLPSVGFIHVGCPPNLV